MKNYFSIICLLTIASPFYAEASKSQSLFAVNDTFKQQMLEPLRQFKSLNIQDSAMSKTIVSLHDELSQDTLPPKDLEASQSILQNILHKPNIKQAYAQAQQAVSKFKEENAKGSLEDLLSSKHLEDLLSSMEMVRNRFSDFEQEVNKELDANLKETTGVVMKQNDSNPDNDDVLKTFALTYKDLSSDKCMRFKHITLASYQIASLVEEEVEAALK